jgi:uncharacterized membrane protein YwzB
MKMVNIMTGKFFLYLLVFFMALWSCESLNINGIFKKGRVYQARIVYFMIVMALTYLVTNFLFDLYLSFAH